VKLKIEKRKGDGRMYEKEGIIYDCDTDEETEQERKYKNRYFNEFENADVLNKDKNVEY